MLTGLNQKVRGPVATSRTGSTWAQETPGEETEPALTLCMLSGTW